MAALAADRKITIVAGTADRYRSGKVAGSVILYKGAAFCWNSSGYMVPAANTAGLKFGGWTAEKVDTTGIADGVSECKYFTCQSVKMKNDATYAVAQANIGGPVWIQDDQTVRNTPGNGVLVGVVESIESDGEVVVFGAPELALPGLVEYIQIPYEHAQATADATHKLYKVPAGKKFRLIGVDYINPTGLAGHADNFFNIKLLKDATVMANWSTDSDVVGQGTIAADTFIALSNSATDADLVAAAGAILALFLDEGGDTTLPLGRAVIRGLLLPAG